MEEQMTSYTARVDAGEELLPHFVAWDRDGCVHMIATPWGDEAEKVRTVKMLGMFFAWKGVDRYIMVSEAWVVVRSVDSTDRREPRNCEDRRECIAMIGVTRSETIACNAMIAGTLPDRAVSEVVWQEPGTTSGRMADLLPPEGFILTPDMDALLGSMFAGMMV
jgi:hypothetical protein